MNTDVFGSPILSRWIPRLVLGAAGALAIYAAVAAPEMIRNAERLRAEQIQQEDREYCTRLKMPPGTDSFAACAAELAEIRRIQHERALAYAAGMP
ncbi:MAG TPA: hypothetical protein VJR30_03920 [Bradyrhizobium sp.]|nr:hypothetical protein [Bradyrhizobium sp.]